MFPQSAADGPATQGTAMRWLCVALWLVLALGATSPVQAQARPADKRIALVIGNSQYPKVPLDNPENDARLMAGNLRKLGFDVNLQLNTNVLQFRRALREFARRVQEDDAISVLYYAGHGVQIDGRNFLLPVDINLRDEEEVKDESVDIEELFLSRIEKARSFPRIVILDACRNNPFAGKTRNIRSAGGLAEMGARGTLIAFASAPGAPAEDGPSGRNSVYTKNLAEEMMVPGLEVEQMFKNVRVKVLRDTSDRQLPWVNTSLTSNFSFNPSPDRPQTGDSARQAQIQRLETELAKARKDLEAAPARPPRPGAPEPSVLAAATPTRVPGEPVARKFEPNELEQQLERAYRERREALAAAQAAPPQPVPQPVLQPVPQPAPPPPPKEVIAALSPPTPAPSTRKVLAPSELQSLLVGKTHSFRDATAGYLMRLDVRSNGVIYYNTEAVGNVTGNGSGRWELRNDGSLCARFNPVPPSTRARSPGDGCWIFFRDGDKLMRASATAPESAQAEIVKIQ